MTTEKNSLNPYIDPTNVSLTICEASQAVAMLARVVRREDTEPVTLSFDEWSGLVATLEGVHGALTDALGKVADLDI